MMTMMTTGMHFRPLPAPPQPLPLPLSLPLLLSLPLPLPLSLPLLLSLRGHPRPLRRRLSRLPPDPNG